MAPIQRPCHFFQLGKCNKGTGCNFAHVVDPNFKRKACQVFVKGRCRRGEGCTFSHDTQDINQLKVANGAAAVGNKTLENSEALFKDFRWKIPKQTAGATRLGHGLGKFFEQALELVDTEIGTMQEVITLLTSGGGLLRIDELLEQQFDTLTSAQLSRVLTHQLLPFFKIFTRANVTTSVLLRAKVITVYNIVYAGDGDGQRAVSLFAALASYFVDTGISWADSEHAEIDMPKLEAIETSITFLSKLVEVNTPAHADPTFVPIAEAFGSLLNSLPDGANFAMNKAKKSLEKLQLRLGIGQAIPGAKDSQRPVGAHAIFQLTRDMPGELSEEGRRHDNDHADIREISILPTLQEIQSSRNEYLPVADSREWLVRGTPGLVDRQFRLLREDTIGQLRNAAKFELERLQNPQLVTSNENKRQSARTYIYDNVFIASVTFDEYHGTQVVIGFAQPPAAHQKSQAARREWWEYSKRLGSEALICLLSSEASVMFFVVMQQEARPTKLQKDYNLVADPDYAYVVAKPAKQSDIHDLLSRVNEETAHTQLSLVEFPGVLLPAFEPTLLAMQRISENLDLPFADILAPVSTPEHPDMEIMVQPPAYAMKPGFEFDLSSITTNNEPLSFAPGHSITNSALQLAQSSSLDPGQALAVISSLSRSLSAIQGPPGTGKSYTGAQLIRVSLSLSNKSITEIGPILVSTQTNHALDAVLERSIDEGTTEIVRIGGRSKSERLQDVNVRVLAQRLDLTKTEKTQRWELTNQVKKDTTEINVLLDAFASLGKESNMKNHLAENHPSYYEQIFGPDEDGFTLVNHNRGTSFDTWLKGTYRSQWQRRSIPELLDVPLNEMTTAERRIMLNSWISEMKDELQGKLRYALSSYNDSKKKLEAIKTEVNLRILRQANVIGVTTSGLARNLELLRAAHPKLLICEEAGEVLESHMLTALLPSIEHCILIGDHQQLRPQVQNFDLSVESRSGDQYALDVSLFERLVRPRDIFSQPLPLCTLQMQRRMHSSIARLIRQTQYPDLQDGPSVDAYPEVIGMRKRLFWMHHDKTEDCPVDGYSTSRTNAYEVDIVAALVKHLSQQGVYRASDIAVITPYLGQLRKLRNKFSSTHTILLNDRDMDELEHEEADPDEVAPALSVPGFNNVAKGSLNQALRLATIDNFQGEEAKVVIVSLVRSNKENKPGFLKTPNRINVLLSRAQHGMYIIGNTNTTESVRMWHDVIEILRNEGCIGNALELCCPRHPDTPIFVQNTADFVRLSPEAGCDRFCDKQLECGHACVAKCHSDMLHGAVYCMKPCTRLKKGCEHLCPKPCGDQCDLLCMVLVEDVEVTLDCGHEKTSLLCYEYQDPSKVKCHEPKTNTTPGCGHDVTVPCHVDVSHNDFSCPAPCGEVLDCGHVCKRSCSQCKNRGDGQISTINHGTCQQLCDRGYNSCMHRCKSTCHDGKPCPPCAARCGTNCSHARCAKLCSDSCSPCLEEQCSSGLHCPHTKSCPMPCAAPCTWVPCSERCSERLSCGCRCPSVCGEECPSANFCQEHGNEEIKGMQADLLEFTLYKDVDLDSSPCIFTSCGHVFTIDSLDGTMDMPKHYEIDPLTGSYIGLRLSAEPFSSEELKPCPECRGSLRNIARYGRVVRRALLDESTKKLTAWSNHRHGELSGRLSRLEGELMDSIDFPRKPSQDINISGPIVSQVESIKKSKTARRYRKIYQLLDETGHFLHKLSADEQPYQRIHDLVEMVRRQASSSDVVAEFRFSSEELQPREHLQAGNLLSRGLLILLSDVINVHSNTPLQARGTIRVDLTANRELCEELAARASESKNIRQEVEAQVLWARFAAMEYGVQGNEDDEEDLNLQPRLNALKLSAINRLNVVDEICSTQLKASQAHRELMRRDHPELLDEVQIDPMESLADEAAEVRKMLNQGMSITEMRMVYKAMANEFSGTGHWYRCANGHPFTVGECGMPMQLARCPECGASVGGQSHRPTEGVTHASDIDEDFGGLML